MTQWDKNYNFADKNQWRVQVWSNIKKRLQRWGIKPKNAVGLYLAAETDKDRRVACNKGFRPENLIAVERDKETIKKLRANRVIVIEGDILEVAREFNNLDFLMLDFNNGFSQKFSEKLLDTLVYTKLIKPNRPVCINLLRGRDKNEFVSKERLMEEYPDMPIAVAKHRGIWISTFLAESQTYGLLKFSEQLIENGHSETIVNGLIHQLKEHVLSCLSDANFYLYPSGKNWMDSIVFDMFCTPIQGLIDLGHFDPNGTGPKGSGLFKNKTKIAAAKSIRTQRINGSKPPSPKK